MPEIVQKRGCQLWAGARDQVGYGMIRRDGRTQRAHRWMWEQERGTIPQGLEIDHLCENKACVNTNHMELVTRHQNMQHSQEMLAWKNRIRRFHETGEWITAGAAASRRKHARA